MTTALIPISPMSGTEPAGFTPARNNAVFVAHLIATAARVPQTRARRRAEPSQATEAYRALGQRLSNLGVALSRSL
jgi:hypothetical protein